MYKTLETKYKELLNNHWQTRTAHIAQLVNRQSYHQLTPDESLNRAKTQNSSLFTDIRMIEKNTPQTALVHK